MNVIVPGKNINAQSTFVFALSIKFTAYIHSERSIVHATQLCVIF